jgi:hypothetical protein
MCSQVYSGGAGVKSFVNLGSIPTGVPIPADQILEAHAARLLILLSETGTKGSIHGLTKLAKLDFFLRYPEFFSRVTGVGSLDQLPESTMIRFRYGPWDPRYYQVLPYLESRALIRIIRSGKAYTFSLTGAGRVIVQRLSEYPDFSATISHAQAVGKKLGHMSGSKLKDLIYTTFDQEVSDLALGEDIHHAK